MPEENSAASPDAVPEEPPVPESPAAARPRHRVALVAVAVVATMAVAVAVITLTASPTTPYAAGQPLSHRFCRRGRQRRGGPDWFSRIDPEYQEREFDQDDDRH